MDKYPTGLVHSANMKLLICLYLLCQAAAFAPTALVHTKTMLATSKPAEFESSAMFIHSQDHQGSYHLVESQQQQEQFSVGTVSKAFAGLSSALVTFASTAAFAGEEIEMAELPPPWVPAVFAVLLLIGVGVLTGSLGNVMDEGKYRAVHNMFLCRKKVPVLGHVGLI